MIDDEHDRGSSVEDKKVRNLGRYRGLTSDVRLMDLSPISWD